MNFCIRRNEDLENKRTYKGDTREQAYKRNRFIKTQARRVISEGPPTNEIYLNEIVKHVTRRSILLDVGTGTAHIPLKLQDRLPSQTSIIGIDLSCGMIEVAKKNIKNVDNISILRADSFNMPFRDASFDVVAVRLAPYLKREVFRVLRRGGYLIEYGTGLEDWKEVRQTFAYNYAKAFQEELPEEEKGFEEQELLRRIGFQNVEIKEYQFSEYYPFQAMVDVIEFVPIVESFNKEKDRKKLLEIKDKYSTSKGIHITRQIRILTARK